jgi:hypothetical protein
MMIKLSPFEEFMLRFTTLKEAAKGDPSRVSNFYEESQDIREAVKGMYAFLLHSDFERRVFHGSDKHFPQVPPKFEAAWDEYSRDWSNIVARAWIRIVFKGDDLSAFDRCEVSTAALDEARDRLIKLLDAKLLGAEGLALKPNERLIYSKRFGAIWITKTDNPELYDRHDLYMGDGNFDPRIHDGGHLIRALISYLEEQIEKSNEDEIKTDISVSVGAINYLSDTIGLDLDDIFRRWKSVPITFMPTHISNKYGHGEKGSLYDLIDDAVRAYVCDAPAAAIAMCRAALEMVLKNHYGKGQWEDDRLRLGEIIVLASQKFDFIHEGRLRRLTRNANQILHDYSKRNRMSEQDERTILEFMKTVKYLIQRAPA